jgi:hypothetical protein
MFDCVSATRRGVKNVQSGVLGSEIASAAQDSALATRHCSGRWTLSNSFVHSIEHLIQLIRQNEHLHYNIRNRKCPLIPHK